MLYTPSPFMDDCGIFTAAPFHQSESSLKSNVPTSPVTRAAGGRKGYASMVSDATFTCRFFTAGSAHRRNGTFAFT